MNVSRLFLASLCLLGCSPGGRHLSEETMPVEPAPAPPGPRPEAPPPVAWLKGRVLAPEGKIPISGALVYVQRGKPPPLPEGVHCDRCVKLVEGTPFVTSRPDGTFTLPLHGTGPAYLVVQKGAFRRVRPIEVKMGEQEVPRDLTTLPGRMDRQGGDDIPRMAVLAGAWDKIEVSLCRLGLGKLGFFGVDRSTISFDLFECGLFCSPSDPRHPSKLLRDPDTLMKYHVVFIPCSGSDGTRCNDRTSLDPVVQRNLSEFVARGGKLYVTDYSYDFVRQIFPGYLDWIGQGREVGSACMQDAYDAEAEVMDQGLKEWLAAQGIKDFSLRQNWTALEKVNTVDGVDLDGKPAMITPKVWLKGRTPSSGLRPATVSFVRSCGRVLFSTYHTEADLAGGGLLPQEMALLYVILETAVCIEPTVLE